MNRITAYLVLFAFLFFPFYSCLAEETGEDIVEEKYEKVFEIEAYISKDDCLLTEDFLVYTKLKQIETEGGDKRSISMLSKFDFAERKTVWSVKTEGGRPLSSNKDSIITFGQINLRGTRTSPIWDAQVKAINPGNGETIWEYLEKDVRWAGPVGVGKSYIALPVCPPYKKGESPSPVLIVIDIAEGKEVKRIDLKGGLKFVAAVGGEDYAVIEYAGEPAQILCRKLSDGSLAGTFSIENEDQTFAISHIKRLENDLFYCLLTSFVPVKEEDGTIKDINVKQRKVARFRLPTLALDSSINLGESAFGIAERFEIVDGHLELTVKDSTLPADKRREYKVAATLQGAVTEAEVDCKPVSDIWPRASWIKTMGDYTVVRKNKLLIYKKKVQTSEETKDDANAQEWEKVLTVEIYTYTSNTLLSDDTDSLFVEKTVPQEDNTFASSILRYDLNQGKLVWSVPSTRGSYLLFANSDMLFIGATENIKGTRTHLTFDVHLKALSLQTGEQVWEFIDEGVSCGREFLLGKNYVVYQRTGMWNGKQTLESLDASFLDIKTGKVKRTVNSGKAIINKVVTIEQEDYLLAADDTKIYCYKAGTGEKTGTCTPFENSEHTLNIRLAVATDAELYVCVEKLKPPVAPSKSRLRAGTELMHLGLPGLALKKKVDLADHLEIAEEMLLEEGSVLISVRPASGKGRKMLTVAKDLSGDITEKKVEEVEEPEYPIISETIQGKYKLVRYKERYEVYRMSENPAR